MKRITKIIAVLIAALMLLTTLVACTFCEAAEKEPSLNFEINETEAPEVPTSALPVAVPVPDDGTGTPIAPKDTPEPAAEEVEDPTPEPAKEETAESTPEPITEPEPTPEQFSSGDEKVDRMLQEIIDEVTTDDMDFVDKLHELYRYVRDHYHYRKGNYYEVGDTSQALEEVRKILENGCGNCYSYSSLLYHLYRMVGFDNATLVYGKIGTGASPHGWVEGEIDGVLYLFDVETEYAYLYRPFNTGDEAAESRWVDMFMKTYEERKGWLYYKGDNPDS